MAEIEEGQVVETDGRVGVVVSGRKGGYLVRLPVEIDHPDPQRAALGVKIATTEEIEVAKKDITVWTEEMEAEAIAREQAKVAAEQQDAEQRRINQMLADARMTELVEDAKRRIG